MFLEQFVVFLNEVVCSFGWNCRNNTVSVSGPHYWQGVFIGNIYRLFVVLAKVKNILLFSEKNKFINLGVGGVALDHGLRRIGGKQ